MAICNKFNQKNGTMDIMPFMFLLIQKIIKDTNIKKDTKQEMPFLNSQKLIFWCNINQVSDTILKMPFL